MSPAQTIATPASIAALVETVRGEGARLRALDPLRRANALAAAAAHLANPRTPLGARLRELAPDSAGLSPAMVDWALRTSLDVVTAPALLAMLREASPPIAGLRPAVPRLVSVVLAGNVFTAALRPLLFPLALGAPVICKSSSRDDVFPALLAESLRAIDPEVGAALAVTTFPGGTEALEAPIFAKSDVVVAYGGDRTMGALRARLAPTVRLVEHGHGVSVAYVGRSALADEARAAAAAERLALDVAAYDQRGCLSPHVAWIARGGAIDGRRFLSLLHEALARFDETLPRGPIPDDVAAAQMQWRAVAAVRGELREGRGHAAAHADDAEVRLGPGWRNVALIDCDGPEEVAARVASFGSHLKCIGVAGDPAETARLVDALPPPTSPRITALGRMQTPPLAAFTEGLPPLDGMMRWVQREDEGTDP